MDKKSKVLLICVGATILLFPIAFVAEISIGFYPFKEPYNCLLAHKILEHFMYMNTILFLCILMLSVIILPKDTDSKRSDNYGSLNNSTTLFQISRGSFYPRYDRSKGCNIDSIGK